MKEISKLGILCGYSFPEGMAPTTRIIAYGNGLVQNGVEVEVVIDSVYFKENVANANGEIKGIKYVYPFFYNKKFYKYKWYRLLYANWALYYKVFKSIYKSHKIKKYDYILLSFDFPRSLVIDSFILRLMGIKMVFIGDEFPEEIRRLKNEVTKKNLLLFKIAYRFISGRILMTNALKEFYDEKVCSKPTYILSSVIDTSRFDNLIKRPVNREYLCYMGNLMLAKDNVDNIVEAFALIKDKYQYLDLHLYGTPNDRDKQYVVNLIQQLGLEHRVILKGRANYQDVPEILYNAKVLVTSQPRTKRAQGGFPTKMCEYMLADVPSILTDVGEITQYVTDGINAFIVEPCNPHAYAQKLEKIISNYDEAMQIAHNAREFVLDNYGSKQATKGLVDFLNAL